MPNRQSQALQFLKKPDPYQASRHGSLAAILGVSVFVFLFFLLFRPFGLKYLGSADLLVKIGENAALVFLVLCFNILVLPKLFGDFFADANWTIFKRILFTLYNLTLIGFLCFLHAHYRGQVPLSFANMIHFEIYALLIGSFPLALLLAWNHIHLLMTHLRTAQKLNRSLQRIPSDLSGNRTVTLTSENGRDTKQLPARSLVLLASADNYVIIFAAQENRTKKEFLRSSLGRIEEALKQHPEFLRCHRSYLVNLRKIKAVAGNSQGYRLTLESMTQRIPVARSHAKEFKERMEALRKA